MLKELQEALHRAAQKLDETTPYEVARSISFSELAEHGDYSSSLSLKLAKILKKNPFEVAKLLKQEIEKLKIREIEKIEVAPPGFLNFTLSKKSLLKLLTNILKGPGEWGQSKVGAGKIVIAEYFQLNIAKPPHVGHLRSAVIGDAIKRMLVACGYHAVSDTHVGDWGTQFGILLLQYKKLPSKERDIFLSDIATSARAYTEASLRLDENPEELERAKEEFAKLEKGDSESRIIWEKLVANSMRELEKSAKRLGLLPFDEHRGESFYEDKMGDIVELALKKGVAQKTSEGAVVVDLSADKLNEAVLIKSDGASTYLLRDLATIQYRKQQWNFWKNLYVVDVRQSHHFQQVFRVAELLGFEGVGSSEHIEFGFMSSKEGALSTRKGTAISLDAVLDEARERALKVIREKNPDLENPEEIAEIVGLGALKYFDLSHHRRSNVVFDWDSALSFEGDTGPYLQYTHARLKSILRKVNVTPVDTPPEVEIDELEHRLLVTALRLPEVVEEALVDFTPHTLAQYLYKLATLANEFYHSHPVVQESNEAKKQFRTLLITGVALTLSEGLSLLGIVAPEEM